MKSVLFLICACVAAAPAYAVREQSPCTEVSAQDVCEHEVKDRQTGEVKYCCPRHTIESLTKSQHPALPFDCLCTVEPFEPTPLETFRDNVLERHNYYRSDHGSQSLTASDDLNEIAQQIAQVAAGLGTADYTTDLDISTTTIKACGKWDMDFSGPDEVDFYYLKISKYDFSNPGFNKEAEWFTQLLWDSTTELGSGKARTADGKCVFATFVYNPAGNKGDAENFKNNVFEYQG